MTHLLCEVGYMDISAALGSQEELPYCSVGQTHEFTTRCGLIPSDPTPPPARATPSPPANTASSAAALTLSSGLLLLCALLQLCEPGV
jgi:hypothetical protein